MTLRIVFRPAAQSVFEAAAGRFETGPYVGREVTRPVLFSFDRITLKG